MKKLLILMAAVTSLNSFALTNSQVKRIVTFANAQINSSKEVIAVKSSLNPIIGLGQLNDYFFQDDVDFEFKRVVLKYKAKDPHSLGTVDAYATCESLVSFNHYSRKALVDVRACKDNETDEFVDRRIYVEELDLSHMYYID